MKRKGWDMAVETIVVHASCVDGFVSELLLREAYPEAKVLRVQHGDELNRLEPSPNMLFCDIAPPVATADRFFDLGATVLDHHKTAAPVFALSSARGEYSATPGVSGAVLAFRHVMGNGKAPSTRHLWVLEGITKLVGIYDTWVDSSPEFERACAAHAVLDLYKGDPDAFSTEKIAAGWENHEQLGRLLFLRTVDQARRIARRAIVKTIRLGDRDVRVGCLTDAVSAAVLNQAAQHVEADVVLSAFLPDADPEATPDDLAIERADVGDVRASLRSRDPSIDCAELAARFGGGGHKGAAGFGVPRQGLVRPVQRALDELVKLG